MADVSVIIPSHNVRDFVGQAIESVLDQTELPSQILVVDDSTDDSADVISAYERQTQGQVQLIRVEPCNVSQARNVGLDRATGSFVAFLDADDVWLEQKTARQLALLESDGEAAGAFCGLFAFRNDLDDQGRKPWPVMQDRPSLEQIIMTQMAVASASMVRRQALGAVRFDERTGHAEDTIFAGEVALVGPWRCDLEPMLARRQHATQVTANPWHTVWSTQTRVQWCRSHADRIGPQLAADLERQLWSKLVEFVERRYWTRQLRDLRAIRSEVGKLCPQVMAHSPVAGRRIYPAWTYKLRDMFARRGR